MDNETEQLVSERKARLDRLRARDEVITRNREATQRWTEETEWITQVQRAWPSQVEPGDLSDLKERLRLGNEGLEAYEQHITSMKLADIRGAGIPATSMSTAGTALFGQVSVLVCHPEPGVAEFARKHTESFDQMLTRNQMSAEVSRLLGRLKPSLIDLFTKAEAEVARCQVQPDSASAAGIALRNVIEKVKGELLALARPRRQPQKSKIWSKIVQRLAITSDPVERQALDKSTEDLQELWNELSDIGHENRASSPDQMRAYFNRLQMSLGALLHGLSLR